MASCVVRFTSMFFFEGLESWLATCEEEKEAISLEHDLKWTIGALVPSLPNSFCFLNSLEQKDCPTVPS